MNKEAPHAPASSIETRAVMPDSITTEFMKTLDKQLTLELKKIQALISSDIEEIKRLGK